MSKIIVSGGIGLVSGFLFGVFTLGQSWDTPKLKEMKEVCQKDLPRSQSCELIAVPKVLEE